MPLRTYADSESAGDFARKTGSKYPFDRADDKLLKTIIRANPGVVIGKTGTVVDMYRPQAYSDIRSGFCKTQIRACSGFSHRAQNRSFFAIFHLFSVT
jgi:hypothetical protein